ncbi:hypothetical protein [Psychrobacter aquaticus]|uniref:Uncharacterized protein n=1 Tax=Psychrobacter aquaticus CMS 56 TaxID=1354303 RepID=U4T3L2_9GAMM|nr:hypothetical protein [Psychrobacter aquaticus]ERL54656.1 hypothetical protein M917_2804 [Psychrobacter aquaticus CMS 56]
MNEFAKSNGFTEEILEILKEIINKDFDRFYGLTDPDLAYDDGSPNIFEKSATDSGLDLSRLECWELSEYVIERIDDQDIEDAYWSMRDAESAGSQDEDENYYLGSIADDAFRHFDYLLKNSLKNKIKYFKVVVVEGSGKNDKNVDYIFFIE